jgi:prolyl oligopeptidase PreP (S9A serine peptidase family)
MSSTDIKLAPVSKETLILMINQSLRKDWTYDDYANGKPIDLQWRWGSVLEQALCIYRDKGWDVKVSAVLDGEGRKLHLRFKNQQWQLRGEDVSS